MVAPAVRALALCALACAAGAGDAGGAADDLPFTAVSFGAGGAALGALVASVVGAGAREVAPPAACGAPDSRACLDAVLGSLARGALLAALVPAARAPAGPRLRDAGLEELGDAAPGAHRACWARAAAGGPAPRSLLEVADAPVGAAFALSDDDLRRAHLQFQRVNGSGCGAGEPCAALLAAGAGEAGLLAAVLAEHGLRARLLLVEDPAHALEALAPRPVLVCGRALPAARLRRLGARALSPPPCLAADCPFEARRLIKLVNARELARRPAALRALARLELDAAGLAALEETARTAGAEQAARAALAAHPEWARAAAEVRVAVMIPASSRRQAHDAAALRAAAELAEQDAARDLDFKAELLDDGCSGARAFQYLTAALASEFGALSAVAGPACGAPFADVARQSAGLALPVLAYTPQAPPPADAARLALLAAGDARAEPAALAALLARLGWRRVSVLSELGTRAALEPARLAPHLVAHVELPAGDDRLDADLVQEWAARSAAGGARVLLVLVEDARAARAALCAGRRAGLLPAAGAVWLLAGGLPAGWLRPRADHPPACSRTELEEAAEGHLSVAPQWAAGWRPPEPWAARWRRRCARLTGAGACGAPPPAAGLLYDALSLWAAALARLLRAAPAAADDLHRDDLIESVVADAARAPFAGVTGAWAWERAGGARARTVPLVLRQWRAGAAVPVGAWAAGALTLDEAALRWATADGHAPDDGAERCSLQALASVLRADCRVAYAVAAALPLALLAALLGAGAWRWRRRARREQRARLVALGLRSLGKAGPDRWELARSRVVINRKLGAGAFGTVYGGHALLAGRWAAVAVKTLKAGASTEEKLDFLAEAEAMKRLDHENVVRLLGVITASEPACTVMEFALYGDLKTYLLARRHLAGGGAGAGEVAPARLTRLAADAARALAYLARLRFVHRDVAARNCLVSASRRLKLADFGMARPVGERDYYRFGRRGMLPVRWMAPESLALGVFSPASDVWAFGVLLYEVVTLGALPFQGLSNAQVLARVTAGRPLDAPRGLRPQLAEMLAACWRREAGARPTAAALAAQLAAAPRLLVPCPDVPLDALPLDGAPEPDVTREAAQARWLSWAAPPSAATDSSYLSAEPPEPHDTDAFLA